MRPPSFRIIVASGALWLLTQPQVERIHDASLDILANVGLLVRNERAMRKVRDILTQTHPSLLSSDADTRVRAAFTDLPTGDAKPYVGWPSLEGA